MCFDVSNQHICYFQPKLNPREQRGNWESARKACEEHNATLPITENHEVQQTFEQYLKNNDLHTEVIWIGGKQVKTSNWKWFNNNAFDNPG